MDKLEAEVIRLRYANAKLLEELAQCKLELSAAKLRALSAEGSASWPSAASRIADLERERDLLRNKAEKEDGCFVSVGGLAADIEQSERCWICHLPKGECKGHYELVDENFRLRAENARLRAALEQCAECLELHMARASMPCESAHSRADADSQGWYRALANARAALAGKE